VAFDQPVQLDAGAMTLALHTNNVSFANQKAPGSRHRTKVRPASAFEPGF